VDPAAEVGLELDFEELLQADRVMVTTASRTTPARPPTLTRLLSLAAGSDSTELPYNGLAG
jgi:hypothetical protein